MSGETNRDLKLEIAHVLFIDIVGYSKLLHNEQSEVLRELNEIVRNTEQFRAADAAGALLRLPTGDGVALRSEEHTSELQSHSDLVCRLLLEKKKQNTK